MQIFLTLKYLFENLKSNSLKPDYCVRPRRIPTSRERERFKPQGVCNLKNFWERISNEAKELRLYHRDGHLWLKGHYGWKKVGGGGVRSTFGQVEGAGRGQHLTLRLH